MKKRKRNNERVIRIYQEFFKMLLDGTKTLEVRILYHFMMNIKVGTILRFNDDTRCRFRIVAVRTYNSFEDLLDFEDISKIDPTRSYEQQLQNLRKIYPPEKEKIGPVVYELEKV